MKKTLITLASLMIAGAAFAQTTTSANIVGYSKAVTVEGLQILSDSFTSEVTSTPESLFGDTLPYGSQVLAFPPPSGPYQIATFNQGFWGAPDAWDITFDLPAGTGFWVKLPSGSSTTTNILSGDVNMAASVTNTIVEGLQILSNPYPVDMTVLTAGFTPDYGDQVMYFPAPNGPYQIATYNQGFWGAPDAWDVDITIPVGEGFWYSAANGYDWVAIRPF